MTAMETVREEVLRRLGEAGIGAMAAYSRSWAQEQSEAMLAVSICGCESTAAGLGVYLGERYDEETAAWQEEYGQRCELTVALDAYSPRTAGALACETVLERAHDVLLRSSDGGIRAMEMKWEAVCWDADSGMFLQKGRLACSVYLIAAVEEETGLLLDFRLKGVPYHEQSST